MDGMPSFADPANLERTGEGEKGERLELGPDATSLTFLQQVYHNSDLPLMTRMRAAGMAIPFEHPKLGVSMNIPMSEEFGHALERAIARANEAYAPRVIEHQPKPVEHPPTTKPMASLPDRRFRRV